MTQHELFQKLFEPFDDSMKATKRVSGQKLTFVEWYNYVARGWREFPAGYSKEIRYVQEIGAIWTDLDESEQKDDRQLVVCVRVTDNESGTYHEALGTAPVRKDKALFGGAMAEAESQAFRRAMANFGMGLEMYMDQDEIEAAQEEEPVEIDITDRQKEVLRTLAPVLEEAGMEERVHEWRTELKTGRPAGAIIREMRKALESLEIPDPTKADAEQSAS